MATAEPAGTTTPRKPCGHNEGQPDCPACSLFVGDSMFRETWGGIPESMPTDPNRGSTPCECPAPGPCPRYGREMRGRLWEICRGINVDLGTAALYRRQWERDAGPMRASGKPRRLVLTTNQAPGDTLCMTAAVYSLHRAHPGMYVTAVQSPHPEVWQHNPDVAPLGEVSHLPHESVAMHYPAVHESNDRGIHFMQGWCEHLAASVGVPVPLLTNRPRLYLHPTTQGDYWLVCSGIKRDFTLKAWGHERYQEVVDRLAGKVKFIQVGARGDDHRRLEGVLEDAVGETSLRSLFYMAARARGVLCGVSLLMHVAAALEKPAVVIAGGREPVQWNAYPKQHYLHTIGMLPCTTPQWVSGGACWRARLVPLGDGSEFDAAPCLYPEGGVGRCMTLVRPEEVAELILRYNAVGG